MMQLDLHTPKSDLESDSSDDEEDERIFAMVSATLLNLLLCILFINVYSILGYK